MQADPLITIGIAVYNGSNYIIETLDSINTQTYKNIEIIIVDDGSRDNSFELCNSWASRSCFPITISKNVSNLGLPATRNILLSKVNGKYISLFDQDDIMLPNKIQSDVSFFEKQYQNVSLIYSNLILINENGELLNQKYFERIGFVGIENDDLFVELTKKNFIPAPSVMIRANAIKKTGGYDETLEFDDWDMWLRLSKDSVFAFSDAMNVYYRIHSNSMMANKNIKQAIVRNKANIRMFQKHLGTNEKYDDALYEKLKELSIYGFFLGDKDSKVLLRNYLEKKFDGKIWLYHKLALLGMKHPSKFKFFTV